MSDQNKLSTSNIQAALKASKSKKSNPTEPKEPSDSTLTEVEGESTEEASTKAPRSRLTDEERAERIVAQEKERLEKRAVRDQEREVRRAAKQALRSAKVPHMAKVEKQAKNLPQLTESAQELVVNIQTDFDEPTITSIVAHLSHGLRAAATSRALTVPLKEGQLIRILAAEGSSAKWVGHLANVLQAQRIRCYVQPVGTEKKVYLFSSNVQVLADEEIESLEQSTDEEAVSQTA